MRSKGLMMREDFVSGGAASSDLDVSNRQKADSRKRWEKPRLLCADVKEVTRGGINMNMDPGQPVPGNDMMS